MRGLLKAGVVLLCGLCSIGQALADPPQSQSAAKRLIGRVCDLIEAHAEQNGLPKDYFARLIWKESRFDPNAVSPVGAEGIAQFMPGTARDRGLADPFHAGHALTASAHLLADLRDRFGNLGLAAAAYNAGEDRVQAWIEGGPGLPAETLDYVFFITGRPAADWRPGGVRISMPTVVPSDDFTKDCIALASRRAKPPAPNIGEGEWKPWGIQLAASGSETIALAAFGRIRARHSSLLSGIKPLVIRKRNPAMAMRRMVNVMVGAESRAEAERLCGKLRQAGGACLVRHN